MKKEKANHYMLDTDRELFIDLLEKLQEEGIENLTDLANKIKELRLYSFTDLCNYISGPNCNNSIAQTIEELIDRLRLTEPKRDPFFTSSHEVGNYLVNKLTGRKQEEFWAFYIDNSNHIVAEKKISQGTLDRAIVHPRDVFRWACIFNCASIIIAHNHPSGKLLPSQNDFKVTKDLAKVANLMKINLLDHFILGKGHYLSMKENELF